jgi:hypothetical protein
MRYCGDGLHPAAGMPSQCERDLSDAERGASVRRQHRGDGLPTPSAVHQCGVAMAALQPTPSAVNQCGGVAGIQPTPTITIHTHCFAGCVTQQCTVATVCTQPPACPPHTVPPACQVHTLLPVCHPSVNVVCPTPSAVQQCGVFTPFCPQ